MRLRQRFVVYVLSALILFSSVFSAYFQTAYAASFLGALAKAWEILQYVLAIDSGTAVSSDLAQDFYNTYKNRLDSIEYTQNSDGTITFSAEAMQQLRDLFDEYLSETPEAIDVVWLPVITEKNLKASWFSSLEDYGRSSALLNTHDLVAFMASSVQFTIGDSYLRNGIYADFSDVVMYGNFNDTLINAINYITPNFGTDTTTGTLYRPGFADTNGVNYVSLGWQVYNTSTGSWVSYTNVSTFGYYVLLNPFFKGSLPWKNQDIYIFCASSSSGIHYVPCFRSLAAYKDYVTGNGNYYRFDSGYTGGDITINPDADYSEITDAIKDAMQAAIASGKNLTNALSDMQKAFTSALDKLNGTLGDISDNTQETNKWLELIYQLLEDQQTDLQDYFASAGESLDDLIGLLSHTDSDGSRTSIYDLLGSFLLLFRVQQEDLQAYMDDAQDFFKMLPVEIGIFFRSATKEITDAIQDVVDAIDGIRINIDYGDVDGDGSDSESLWKLLGEGVAKILTAILGLLKVLIFKGLDALAYLVGVVVDNVNGVFEELTSTVDVIISDLEESNALYADLGEAIPVQIQNILVLFVFVLGFCAILSYLRR